MVILMFNQPWFFVKKISLEADYVSYDNIVPHNLHHKPFMSHGAAISAFDHSFLCVCACVFQAY